MSVFRACDGCGRELNLNSDKQYPQRNEVYCAVCNPHFSGFDTDRRKLYFKFDMEKKGLLDALKSKHFGPKVTDTVELPTPVEDPNIKAHNEARAALKPTGKVKVHTGTTMAKEAVVIEPFNPGDKE